MDKPIGFWLKHLDGLIDRTFDHVLGRSGLQRRHWQVLNTVHDGGAGAGRAEVAEALRPFWATHGGPSQREIVDDLMTRGWLRADGEAYALTDQGRRAHADLLAEVAGIRARSLDGLTGDDYSAAVGTLRRMSANLERAMS
jgi:hypothetical protein